MPPLTPALADAVLKRIWQKNPKYYNSVCYTHNPFLALIPKNTNFLGRSMPVVLEYGFPTGVSSTFGAAQANAAPSDWAQFDLTRIRYYGNTMIEGETAEAMASSVGSLVEGMESQSRGIMQQVARQINIQLYRNGSGIRGVVQAGTGTNTLTLTNPQDAALFERGMVIDGCTGAGAPHGTPDTIAAIDRIAGTLTSTAATWNAAILNGDNLFVEGDYPAAAAVTQLSGFEAWVPAAAPGAGLFFGVNRTLDALRLGGQRLNAAALGLTIGEALIRGAYLIDAEGGIPTHVFLNPLNYSQLATELDAKVQYERVQTPHIGMSGVIGFNAIKIDGPKGPVMCVSDNACPVNVACMVQLDNWTLNTIGNAPKFLSGRFGGDKWIMQHDADSYKIVTGLYGQVGCSAPGWQCRIAL